MGVVGIGGKLENMCSVIEEMDRGTEADFSGVDGPHAMVGVDIWVWEQISRILLPFMLAQVAKNKNDEPRNVFRDIAIPEPTSSPLL